MCKYRKTAAIFLLMVLAVVGTACQSEQVPFAETQSDELAIILPDDWQWLEDWRQAEDVPRLLLQKGEESIEPASFGRSWSYALPGIDEMSGYIACGMHPLEAKLADLPQLSAETEQDYVFFIWQAAPDEVSVTAYAYDLWEQRTCGNTLPDEILHTEVAVHEDGTFRLLADEHTYVYVINASWGDKTELAGGYGEWAFCVKTSI